MKRQIALLASALLLGGSAYAQDAPASPKPRAYMVSNAHMDTQWNWDIQTTIKEYVWNTINQNLFLIKRYPDYIFNFEGGVKYSWMKEYYPTQYEELKKAIANGRWHVCGSSWDATDALVPSAESAIRNIMLGQNYYRSEFGVESTDIFLPDCFGFGYTLPTVATHCGLIGFSSQKLQWRANPFYGDAKYPYMVGLWTGIDGSSIMMAHGNDYNTRFEDSDLSENNDILALTRQSPLGITYRYYGVGDRGGSPTVESVRALEKGIAGNGPVQIISAASDRVYKEYLPYDSHPELPRFDGELLMDVHGTGCYTSQAAMKLYNRQNELLGDAAERASVVAEWLNQATYPGEALTENWKRFIFHQFHDDLTGTSIPRAYEFSWNDELIALSQFAGIITSSTDAVARKMNTKVQGIPVIFYNALGFPVTDLTEVELDMPQKPKGITVYDVNGRKVASQLLSYTDGKARFLVEATVPATGYAVYDVRTSGSSADTGAVTADALENSVYKIGFDNKGDIVSLFDKKNNKELVKSGRSIRLAVFEENKSYVWPAWEILKETIDREPVSIDSDVKMTLVENGALRKTMLVEKRHGDSSFKQYIHLYEGSRADRIDFSNEVDWQSANALLKAEFPLSVSNEKATYDLGIGSIERGNNTTTSYEVYAQYWADLTDRNGDYGVSVMNDSKYGWDKPDDNTLRLTLLHTPETDRDYAYQNRQDFGHHCFTYSLVGHAGRLDKPAIVGKAEILNQKLKAFRADKHKGQLGREFSFVSSDNPNVIIKALKKAENTDEYVVRVYETGGEKMQEAVLSFAGEIIGACEADGTEKSVGQVGFNGNDLSINIKPFSVKTFKVRLKPSDVDNYKLQYANLPLSFNKKCASFNEFRGEADFESGFSYAAELLPDSLVVNGIPFTLGEKEAANGMKCNGETIDLPAGGVKFNRLYLLAAATDGDQTAVFRSGRNVSEVTVPSYTGFIGQWGHTGHTDGYMKDADVAYVGTHRHSPAGDHPYEFTYMFRLGIDIPEGAASIELPKNDKIVLFAATLVQENQTNVKPVTTLFNTAIPDK